jgi:RHS repeat-associated protein
LRAFYIQASSGSEPSVYTHYLYDGGGNRIKKLTRKDSGKVEVTVYIDDVFEESYIKPSGSSIDSNHHWNTLHIMDDSSRVATIRAGTDNNDSTPAIKYNLEDHLGSSSMMVDDSGTLVNREEYYPFGDTSFGGFAKKRYRYTGKEKDEESGLYYYGARYYAPWTCRFISVDPMAIESFYQSPYGYGDNNPIIMNDPSGNQSEVKGTDDSSNKQEGNGGNGGQNGSNTANKGGDKWEEETSVFEPESYPEGKGKKLKGVEIEATKKTNNLSAFFRGFFYGYDGPTAGDLTREEIRRMTSDPIGYLYSGLESTSDVVNYFVGWALEGTGIGELISDPYTEHYRETNQAIKEKIEGFSELSPYEQGKAARYYLEAGGAAAMSYVIGKKSYKIGRGKLKQLRKKRTAGKVGNKDVEIRSDIVLKGGRGGQRVKNLTGPPNSVVKGGEGRIFITDETGNVIWDITKNRAKPVFPGKGFGQKMQPTQKQINLLEKVWGK